MGLANAMEEKLSGAKADQIGDGAEKAAYVVGRVADGPWAGLKTTVVET